MLKYSVEASEEGAIETLETVYGTFHKRHIEMQYGEKCLDKSFCTQLEESGCDDTRFIDKVYDTFDFILTNAPDDLFSFSKIKNIINMDKTIRK